MQQKKYLKAQRRPSLLQTSPEKLKRYLYLRCLTHRRWNPQKESHILDILCYVIALIVCFLLNTSTGDQFPEVLLEPNNLEIIFQNSPLPACMRPGKGLPALCLALDIVQHVRVRIWLSIELVNIESAWFKIALATPLKRRIGTNGITAIFRDSKCSVEEASNGEGGAPGETKPGINLIIVDQFDLIGGIGGDIHSTNITKYCNKLLGVFFGLKVPTGSFTELLQSVIPENRRLTLVWHFVAMHDPWELTSLSFIGVRV